ncbi:MAG: lytic transglycosylase domain-containing protein [Hyphomicrobiales bacterium]|nr:lytic transglycosylase domain-containing protein [Hyphomicrobiales bacterium]
MRRIAEQERFFPDFILAVAETESGFDAGKVSARGYGLMQLSEARARASQVDRCIPAQNVRGGVRALRDLHARYRNPFYILADWHAGEEALLDANGLPPRLETLQFVTAVMDRFYDWPALREGRVVGTGAAAPSRAKSAPAPPASANSEAHGPSPSAADVPPLRNGEPVSWRSGFVASFD